MLLDAGRMKNQAMTNAPTIEVRAITSRRESPSRKRTKAMKTDEDRDDEVRVLVDEGHGKMNNEE